VRTSSRAQRKIEWLVAFDELVHAKAPEHSGRIEWADATHLYNSGYSPAEAADRYIAARAAAAK